MKQLAFCSKDNGPLTLSVRILRLLNSAVWSVFVNQHSITIQSSRGEEKVRARGARHG